MKPMVTGNRNAFWKPYMSLRHPRIGVRLRPKMHPTVLMKPRVLLLSKGEVWSETVASITVL